MKRKSLREFLRQRRIKRVFGKFVDPNTLERLLKEPLETPPLRATRIEYILAFVHGVNASQTSERMGAVASIAIKHGATIHHLVSGLMIAAFGTGPGTSVEPGNRLALIAELQREFAAHIKIVRGVADGFGGLLGSKQGLHYSFVVTVFDQILGTLGRLHFGETKEFR